VQFLGGPSLTTQSLNSAIADPRPGELHIDLSRTTFVDPSGLVVTAVLLDQAASEGWHATFVGPDDPQVARYLSRMGLRDRLDNAGCAHTLPIVRHHPPGNRFVELQRFDADHPAEDLADLIRARLSTWGDDYLMTTLYDALFELGLNIEEHAHEPGVVAAQCYQNSRVRVAVGDYGIGIHRSLANAGMDFASPGQAVIEAVTTRLTSKDQDGGAGLKVVADTFTRHRGWALLVSGGEAVMIRDGENPAISSVGFPTTGTFLFGELRWR
jgi:anti-sigma regulatory factor (Ser/Thr protein kinase)